MSDAEVDRLRRDVLAVEAVLTEFGVPLTYPMEDAIREVLVEREALQRWRSEVNERFRLAFATEAAV